jgi:hypothetical protein
MQHQRGREITEYITSATANGRVATVDAEPLARAFATFVPMYENHAAREDTILFPAWKAALSGDELEELGDKFEAIEKAQFGGDGFDRSSSRLTPSSRPLVWPISRNSRRRHLVSLTAAPHARPAGFFGENGGHCGSKICRAGPYPDLRPQASRGSSKAIWTALFVSLEKF